jgi:1,4-alpha-glucan branching enzyme
LLIAAILCLRGSTVRADSTSQPAVAPIADVHASQTHVFHYLPVKGQQQVNIAGDFNGWSTNATPMTLNGDRYEAKLTLAEGVHYYKFVVDGQWLNDPETTAGRIPPC